MSDLRELIQDLLAHAHEAPSQCAGLMRRAATELRKHEVKGEVRFTRNGVPLDPPAFASDAAPARVKGAPVR
jgi:hypothetical protein